MSVTRRNFNVALSASALAAATAFSLPGLVRGAAAQEIDPFDLVPSVPLGDIVLGSANAPVTMIEYASMSCGHCAQFHEVTFPVIKADYIDTRKVRFIFREYPLNVQAAGAAMLARCVSKGEPNKYHEVAGLLFSTQDEWVVRDTSEQLRRIVKKVGMDDDAFNSCIGSQQLVDGLQLGMQYASVKLKIDSTPTFFINGTRLKGAYPIEEFRKLIEARLKS